MIMYEEAISEAKAQERRSIVAYLLKFDANTNEMGEGLDGDDAEGIWPVVEARWLADAVAAGKHLA